MGTLAVPWHSGVVGGALGSSACPPSPGQGRGMWDAPWERGASLRVPGEGRHVLLCSVVQAAE